MSLHPEVIKKRSFPLDSIDFLSLPGERDENEFRAPQVIEFAFYHPIAVLHMCHCAVYRIREDLFCLTGYRLSATR